MTVKYRPPEVYRLVTGGKGKEQDMRRLVPLHWRQCTYTKLLQQTYINQSASFHGVYTNTKQWREVPPLPMETGKSTSPASISHSSFQTCQGACTVASNPEILNAKENVASHENSLVNSCLYPNLANSNSSGDKTSPVPEGDNPISFSSPLENFSVDMSNEGHVFQCPSTLQLGSTSTSALEADVDAFDKHRSSCRLV